MDGSLIRVWVSILNFILSFLLTLSTRIQSTGATAELVDDSVGEGLASVDAVCEATFAGVASPVLGL